MVFYVENEIERVRIDFFGRGRDGGAVRGNWGLRPDAEAFRRMPDFRPIPVERIGLLTPRQDQ